MDYNTIMEERYESGRAEGKAEGRTEGRAEATEEFIIKMKNAGISEEKIREILS